MDALSVMLNRWKKHRQFSCLCSVYFLTDGNLSMLKASFCFVNSDALECFFVHQKRRENLLKSALQKLNTSLQLRDSTDP